MGVYANGHLIYGFVNNGEAEGLFEAIVEAVENKQNAEASECEDEDEVLSFEELHQELQAEHGISLISVGYAGIDILSAYSANASGKGFDITTINSEDLAKTQEYAEKIKSFLSALNLDPGAYTPGWHLLSYMD